MKQANTKHHQTGSREETIRGFLHNNEGILRSLYVTVYPKVRRYVLQNNGSEEQAKDTFQEAFMAAWNNIKEGKISSKKDLNVEAYLFTIAKNKWIDQLRSLNFKKTIRQTTIHLNRFSEEEEEVVKTDEQAQLKAMKEAFTQLGAQCQKLLNLFYFERMTMDEISTELQIASASARNQKYRCMEKLRILSQELNKNG
jgi:RNA polymerase sigma factor (sigma-70 family)